MALSPYLAYRLYEKNVITNYIFVIWIAGCIATYLTQMTELFGVSTDYLLKDSIDSQNMIDPAELAGQQENMPARRKVTICLNDTPGAYLIYRHMQSIGLLRILHIIRIGAANSNITQNITIIA